MSLLFSYLGYIKRLFVGEIREWPLNALSGEDVSLFKWLEMKGIELKKKTTNTQPQGNMQFTTDS